MNWFVVCWSNSRLGPVCKWFRDWKPSEIERAGYFYGTDACPLWSLRNESRRDQFRFCFLCFHDRWVYLLFAGVNCRANLRKIFSCMQHNLIFVIGELFIS